MRSKTLVAGVLVSGAMLTGSAASQYPEIDGILSPTPMLDGCHVAIPLDCAAGDLIVGTSWYNNDSNTVFPKVSIVGADPTGDPMASGSAIAMKGSVPSLSGWTTVLFSDPVVAGTGQLFAVFQFPAHAEPTAEGEGGGPGIGFRMSECLAPAYVSSDGEEWIALRTNCHVEVAAILDSPGAFGEETEGSSEVVVQTSPAPEVLTTSPNPMTGTGVLHYSIGRASAVALDIFDVRGRRITTLVDRTQLPGIQSVSWNGMDDSGRQVPNGVYFVRLRTSDRISTTRITLVR